MPTTETQGAAHSLRLEDIKSRLVALIRRPAEIVQGEDFIKKRALEIQALLTDAEKVPSETQFIDSVTAITKDYQKIEELTNDELRSHEDKTLAYLFSIARRILQETPGAPEFNPETEFLQIQAVLRLLQGDHAQLSTNMGKTSAVLPIAAFSHLFFTGEKSILVGVNPDLVQKLHDAVSNVLSRLPPPLHSPQQKEMGLEVADYECAGARESSGELERIEGILKQQLREGCQSENTKAEVAQVYWKELLTRPTTLIDVLKKPRPGCIITDDRSLVFDLSPDKSIWRKLPHVFTDEVQAIGESGAAYISTHPEPLVAQEELEEVVNLWVLRRVVAESIVDNDLVKEKGDYELTEAGWEKIEQIAKSDYLKNHPIITGALDQVTSYASGDAALRRRLEERFYSWWDSLPPQMTLDLCHTFASEFLDLKKYPEGTIYFYDEKGRLQVRSEYLAVAMEGHYLPANTMLSILARDKKFQFVNLSPVFYSATQFLPFVDMALDGKLSSTSASLGYIDPFTNEVVWTPFGQALAKTTDSKIALLLRENEDVKHPPEPTIGERSDLIAHLAEALVDFRPTMVVAWNERDGKDIMEAVCQKYKDTEGVRNKIAFVGAAPGTSYIGTPDHKVPEKEIYKKMQSGEVLFLISSGKSGLGVDIQNINMRVAIYGIPLTKIQLTQALSRRRAHGDDFLWYIQNDELALRKTGVKKIVSQFQKLFGEVDLAGLEIMLSSTVREERAKAIWLLIGLEERLVSHNYEVQKSLERYFHDHVLPKIINPTIQKLIEKQSAAAIASDADFARYFDFGKTEVLYDLIGLPEDIYWDLFDTLAEASFSLPKDPKDLFAYFNLRLSSKINERLEEWVTERLPLAVEKYTLLDRRLRESLAKLELNKDSFEFMRAVFPQQIPKAYKTFMSLPGLETKVVYHDPASDEELVAVEAPLSSQEKGASFIYERTAQENRRFGLFLKKDEQLFLLGKEGESHNVIFTVLTREQLTKLKIIPIVEEKTDGILLGVLK